MDNSSNYKKIVTISDTEILLDSGMTEAAFGKTDLAFHMNSTGLSAEAEFQNFTDIKLNFKFKPWVFTSTHVESDSSSHVVFEGSNNFGIHLSTLLSIFDDRTGNLAQWAGTAVCSALTQAIQENIAVPENGAGGILVGWNKDTKRICILFLPEQLFEAAASNRTEETYAAIQGKWLRKGLTGTEAVCFTRAAIAYAVLTGKCPYSATNTEMRQADILDRNFIPLEYMINGIHPELSEAVNKGLSLGPVTAKNDRNRVVPEKEFPITLFVAETGLQSDGTIHIPDHKNAISETEFDERRNRLYKKQQTKIKQHRTVRRNTALITGCAVGFILLIAAGINIHNSHLEKPTTIGLSSTQTVQAFYQGVHTLNIDLMQYVSKGKASRSYVDSASAIFVSGKTREAYEHTGGIRTPERWLFGLKNDDPQVYGLTQFRLDGKPMSLDITVPTKKSHPAPVTEENNVPLRDGDSTKHTASYYLLYSQGEKNDIFVVKYQSTVMLTYKDDCWIITNIDSDTADISVDNEKFKSEFRKEIGTQTGAACYIDAVRKMRTTYQWLPTDAVIESTAHKLEKELTDSQLQY